MNDLCYEIGYRSVNHDGEQLCGDHIEVVETNDNSSVVKSSSIRDQKLHKSTLLQ